MFNVGGGEILVILLVALLVVGPAKLPEAARQVGNVLTQVRRMSSGFQNELRTALEDSTTPSDTPPPAPPPAPATPADAETTTHDGRADDQAALDGDAEPTPDS